VSGLPAELPVAGGSDSGGSPRTLSEPEFQARAAEFLALRGRSEDAEDKLEEALMTEPALAEAEQALGFILLKKNDLDEAQKHFDRAVQLDPKDALNFYGQGVVAMAQAGNGPVPPGAFEAFEKSTSLNPDFAPAWGNLALLYSQRNETLAKALADAKRAAALAPGEGRYQQAVAALQDRLSNPDEARRASASSQQSASDRASADRPGDLTARISPRQSPAPPPPSSNTPAKPATSDPGLRIERKTEPDAKPPSTASTASATTRTEPPPAPVVPLFSPTKVYSMMGTITDVNCSNAPQILLTMKSLTIVMKLHAVELAKLSFKSAGSDAPVKETSCSSLRGRSARVSYVLVLNQPWDGEMQEVEFRSQP
jgi:Flp pilus assembly protein TadD